MGIILRGSGASWISALVWVCWKSPVFGVEDNFAVEEEEDVELELGPEAGGEPERAGLVGGLGA